MNDINKENNAKATGRMRTPASKPGVVSVSALDQRIADKCAGNNQTDLEQLERDVISKQRGKASREAMKPGAFAEVTMTKRESSKMSDNRKPPPPSSRRSQLSTFEDAVTAKLRDNTTHSGASHHSNVKNLDEAIAAKLQSQPRVGPAALSGKEPDLVGKAGSIGAYSDGRIADKVASRDPLDHKHGVELVTMKDPLAAGGVLGKKEEYRPEQPRDDLEFGMFEADGLAVAQPVAEEEDEGIPSAIEYDPDSKPTVVKKRRFRLYGLLAVAVLVTVAIGAGVGIGLSQKDDTEPPPPPSVCDNWESLSFAEKQEAGWYEGLDQIVAEVGFDALAVDGSPYAKALDWITCEDPLQLTTQNETFTQRFAAAYFYFATTEDGPWLSCNPPNATRSEGVDCDFAKIASVYPVTRSTIPWVRWLSETPECKWAGVFCDDDMQIRSLELSK